MRLSDFKNIPLSLRDSSFKKRIFLSIFYAFLIVLSITALSELSLKLFFDKIAILLLYPSITLTAWFLGLYAGLFAALFGAYCAGALLSQSLLSIFALPFQDQVRILIFYVLASVIVWIIHRGQQSQVALTAALKDVSAFKFALDQSSILTTTDLDGRITYVNDKFCKVSKYSSEELIGQTHSLVNSGFHSKEFFDHMWNTIRAGLVWKGEILNKAKDGSQYWVSTCIIPFLDEENRPYQYMAIRSDITEKKKAEEALNDNLKTLRHLSFRLQQAQEEERNRISREIHDELGQALTVLKMEIFLLKKDLHPNDEVRNRFRHILSSIEAITASMRSVVADLRPVMLEDMGLVPAIEWWLSGVEKRAQVAYDFHTNCQDVEISSERAVALFRIMQEAVNNSIKHGHAEEIEISLMNEGNGLLLKVRDYGVGIDLAKAEDGLSSGLGGIRERLRPFQGTLRIENINNRGTLLVARLPI